MGESIARSSGKLAVDMKSRRLCIVGAGLSGLVTARTLRDAGHEVSVFEKLPDLGGVWHPANRYPGLRTQSPRDAYAFSDFPMPREFPEFPDGAQVHRYLSAYAEHHNLTSHIRLNCAVNAITRTSEGRWLVRFSQDGAAEASETFDFVVCCNGVFSRPSVPDLPNRTDFATAGGIAVHSSQLHDTAPLKDRDVIVVGFGKSALDIAEAALPLARSVTIVCHRTLWKVPRYLGFINAKHFILSRFAELWVPHYTMQGLRRFLHTNTPWLVDLYWRLSEHGMGSFLGLLRPELRPDLPMRHSVGTCFGLAPSDNFRALRQGRIGLRKGRLECFTPDGLRLSDGTTIRAQTVVFATGFALDCPFLETTDRAALFDQRGVPQLYRLLVCPRIPNMAFNGYNGGGVSQLTAELGARWIAQLLAGGLVLPDVATMEAQIARDLAQRREVVHAPRGEGFYVAPFMFSYLDQLQADMGLPPADSGKSWWRRYFTAVDPSDYARR